MAEWTHAICDACWDKREPFRTPHRVVMKHDTCCFCGKQTDGIYVREDPKSTAMVCDGKHKEDE